jgi:hypothetical protein
MKTLKIASVSVLAVLFFSCNGQTSKNPTQSKKDNSQLSSNELNLTDTVNRPKVKVNVNKRFDDKGRIIQFDSTYSYFYSSPGGTAHLNNDTIFNNFQSFFNKSYPSIFKDQNRDIFFNDSLFKYDFFNDDYFLKRYQLNQNNFESFYKRMDSLKQNFMQQAYPNGYQKKEKAIK